MASDATTRSEIFPSGIASVGLGEVKRQIPVDEPLPLAPNALLAVIGKPVPRQNGRAKVTGATRFPVDIALPGMLHGRILRSPLPHAEVRAIDSAAAADIPVSAPSFQSLLQPIPPPRSCAISARPLSPSPP